MQDRVEVYKGKEPYVFISYSTKNQATADALRALATQNNIPTWMAPYDIPAGSKYAAEITKAIRECTCFALILSNDSQNSDAVDREVELAALTFKKPLVIAQIEQVTLNDSFFFYLHNQQIEEVSDFSQDSPGRRKIIQAIIKHLAADEPYEAFLRISCKDDKVIQGAEAPVTKSTAQCLFERGQQVYELDMCSSSNVVEAVRLFRLAAEQGHAEAQYMLAKLRYIYRYDEAVDVSDEEAARWACLAARQGHREAQSEVGIFYLWGRGVEQNVEEALRWFRLAAEGGDSEAQYYLGLCYYWGEGVERDVILCRQWLEKAAGQNHYYAIEALDTLCAGGDFPSLYDLM